MPAKEGINYIKLGDQESLWNSDSRGSLGVLLEFPQIKMVKRLF